MARTQKIKQTKPQRDRLGHRFHPLHGPHLELVANPMGLHALPRHGVRSALSFKMAINAMESMSQNACQVKDYTPQGSEHYVG